MQPGANFPLCYHVCLTSLILASFWQSYVQNFRRTGKKNMGGGGGSRASLFPMPVEWGSKFVTAR